MIRYKTYRKEIWELFGTYQQNLCGTGQELAITSQRVSFLFGGLPRGQFGIKIELTSLEAEATRPVSKLLDESWTEIDRELANQLLSKSGNGAVMNPSNLG